MCSWDFTWTMIQLNLSSKYRDASLCLSVENMMDNSIQVFIVV
jgi:hypothetical protein